ncbi:hypothetical protein RU86_GL000911 [Lactococcus piscium]|uniref:Uncharacterized protein n=1 Tax=Pseudolactococcus piscium TaxID=1364 RepID=A0A2A5RVK9_9LACT|nr:hypothetical protein RU86_GL000911 [Lactococcus piscium]
MFDVKKFYKFKYIYLIELAIIAVQIMLVVAVMHNNDQDAVARGKYLLDQHDNANEVKVIINKQKIAPKLALK